MASLSINDELHKKFKLKCIEIGVVLKKAAEEAVNDWLNKINNRDEKVENNES